ncbi:MAG: dynamin family protein [Salinibacterium sp.]|nr:dynamin family protein [Salinibacterium sp.]
MVKAGKSTLLNAFLGEQIAPTDTGECTRVVTAYRYSATPEITIHPFDSAPRRMPIRRDRGRLVFSLDGMSAEEVEWVDVAWPLESLRSLVLIDTPGTASLSEKTSMRTARYLTSEESPSAADAVVYLMRHLHGADVRFLEAFRDNAPGSAQTVSTVGVLSRADEIGSGRIDSLLSARKVAGRYERHDDLGSLVLGVIPVAGLLAEGARTLRESEFIALRELARLDRAARERLLVSADRFMRPTDLTSVSEAVRADLLDRFGTYGIRLATALVRGGAASSSELSQALVEQSGLLELEEFVREQFLARTADLKARGVVVQLEWLLRNRPRPAAHGIRDGIEAIVCRAHAFRELELLARARLGALPLSPDDAAAAQRILGARGVSPHRRLGLREAADASEMRAGALDALAHWRSLSAAPLANHELQMVCRVVIRSLDGIASEVGAARALRPAPHVVLPSGPTESAGKRADEQGEQAYRRLRRQKRLNWFARFVERHPFRR